MTPNPVGASAISDAAMTARPPSPAKELWRDFSRNRGAVIGLVVIVALLLCALLADVIAPYSPKEQFTDAVLKPPSTQPIGGHVFVLGTDPVGRDVPRGRPPDPRRRRSAGGGEKDPAGSIVMARLVYGVHPVREALKSGRVQALFVLEGEAGAALRDVTDAAQKANIQPVARSRAALDLIARGGVHQGAVALTGAQPPAPARHAAPSRRIIRKASAYWHRANLPRVISSTPNRELSFPVNPCVHGFETRHYRTPTNL